MKYLSHSLAETNQISLDFLAKISQIKNEHALVVALFGDLGSGKTTFTQALGKNLGVQEVITSPTFVIRKKYSLTQSTIYNLQFTNLIHIDAYRLDSAEEILNLNFAEDLADKDNLILIEWPERVREALPKDILEINFSFIDENRREIEF